MMSSCLLLPKTLNASAPRASSCLKNTSLASHTLLLWKVFGLICGKKPAQPSKKYLKYILLKEDEKLELSSLGHEIQMEK
jgi:hypothetical protein